MEKPKDGAQAAGNEPEPLKTMHGGQEKAHKNSIGQNTLNDKVKASNPYDIGDYVKAAYCKIKGEPKPQGVRFDAKSPEFSPGGPFEALGYAVAQLKAGDSLEIRGQIFDGLVKEFHGDGNGLIQLGSLRGLLDPWKPGEPCPDQKEPVEQLDATEGNGEVISHEPLPVEFGGDDPLDTYIPATLAEARQVIGETKYLWPSWIMRGGLTAIAGDVGAGKTEFVMDLWRRMYEGLPWPDNAAMDESGGKIVYLMADQRLGQLADLASSFGIPDESIVLAHEPGSVTAPLLLDDPKYLKAIAGIVQRVKPRALVIDTFTSAMGSREHNKPEIMNGVTSFLHDIAISNDIAVILLCHTNSEGGIYGKALGRKCEHQMSLVLSNRHEVKSPRNIHPKRSRRMDNLNSIGVFWGPDGWGYGEPHEEFIDSARGDITVKKTIKDETSEQALSMAAIAGDKGFTQIELVTALMNDSGKQSEADKSKYQNQVSRAIRALIQAGKLREENRRYYQSAF